MTATEAYATRPDVELSAIIKKAGVGGFRVSIFERNAECAFLRVACTRPGSALSPTAFTAEEAGIMRAEMAKSGFKFAHMVSDMPFVIGDVVRE